MPAKTIIPTSANPLGAWTDGQNATGYNVDGYGATNTGAGFLALTQMTGRNDIPVRDALTGFEVAFVARLRALVQDTFTDTAGRRLDQHTGEINAAWQRPNTGYDPSYQRINAAGRTYYGGENGSGPTTNGAEHFLTAYTPPAADYAVEARIYAATDGGTGEYAEIYARATTPNTFYILQYDEGTNTWRLGYWNSVSRTAGQMTSLGTYAGDVIAPGSSRLARLQVQGTSITAFVDGVQRISATSNHITAAGYPGLRLDAGAGRSVNAGVVTAAWDLGSAQTVTRIRRRFGWINSNAATVYIEGSNDGTTWVNALTGPNPPVNIPTGSFQWENEWDTTQITTTAYRYWRVYNVDSGTPCDVRIGDFRIYVGGVLQTVGGAVTARAGFRAGTTPHNWTEMAASSVFSDNSPGDTTSWAGGTPTVDLTSSGLQFEDFTVSSIPSASLNVSISANGITARGTTKNVSLTTNWTNYIIGGPNDLFGASWKVEEVRAATFGILCERGSASSTVEIDAAQVIVYHVANGGSIMPIREQVRQQILIGREVGVNEGQTLTITGTPTGGTFRITFNGVETANIAFNATAANVQTALEAISSIGTGNITCTGGVLPGTAVVMTFGGSFAAEPQSLMTVTNAALTGGTTPTATIARTTTGVRAAGNGATANVRLRHARIQPQPAPEFLQNRPAGEKLTNHQVLLKEQSEGPIEGIPTYDEMGWLLSGIIARPNTSTLQAAAAFRHVFVLDNRVRDNIATFQAEYGDQFARAHRIRGMIINAIDLALRQDGIDLGGSVMGRAIEDGITMNPGAATVQTFTMSGTGTFRLRWKGQETVDLNSATETAATLQTALRNLAGINNSTALTVTGASSPFTITFGNASPFLGFPQPLLETRIISGTPTLSVAMTTRGGYTDYPGQIILPRHVEMFLSPTLANIGTAKLTDVFSTGLSIANKNVPVYNLDRNETSWFTFAEGSNLDVNFSMIAQANAPIMSFLSQARTDTVMFLRILATGPLIGTTAFPHRLQIDCPVKISNFGPFGENQETYAFEYEFAAAQDDATNTNLVVTLDNAVSAY